jgi:hypothetical protein
MRSPADIRKLIHLARKVSKTARPVGPTGEAFAEVIDGLITVIEELRDELRVQRQENVWLLLKQPRKRNGPTIRR